MCLIKFMILQKLINLLIKAHDFTKTDKLIIKKRMISQKLINLIKTYDFITNDKLS